MALTPFDPKNNPFDAFSQEDKDSIKEQLQVLRQNPSLNSAQHAGITRTLRYLGVEPEPFQYPQPTRLGGTIPRSGIFDKGAETLRTLETTARMARTPRRVTDTATGPLQQSGINPESLKGPQLNEPDVLAASESDPVKEFGRLQKMLTGIDNDYETSKQALEKQLAWKYTLDPRVDLTNPKEKEEATQQFLAELAEEAGTYEGLKKNPTASMQKGVVGTLGTTAYLKETDPHVPSFLGTAASEDPAIRLGVKELWRGQIKRGVTHTVGGGFQAATPLMIYAGVRNPIALTRGLMAAELGSTATDTAAKKLGASAEDREFYSTLGALIPGAIEGGRSYYKGYREGYVKDIATNLEKQGVPKADAALQAEHAMKMFESTGDPAHLDAPGQATTGVKLPLTQATRSAVAATKGAAAGAMLPTKEHELEANARGLGADVQGTPKPTLPEVKRGTYLDKVQKAGTGTQASELAAHSLGKAAFGESNYDVTQAPDGRFTVTRKEAVASTQQKIAEQTAKAVENISANKPLATSSTAPAPKPAVLPEQKAAKPPAPVGGAAKFRQELLTVPGISEQHADSVMALMEGNAKYHNMNFDDYVNKFYAGVKVGGSVGKGALYQTALKDLGFRSKVEEIAHSLPERMTAEQALATLVNKGAKREELAWTGLDELLGSKRGQPVTKSEIVQHLQENGVKLDEITYGGEAAPDNLEYENLQAQDARLQVEAADLGQLLTRGRVPLVQRLNDHYNGGGIDPDKFGKAIAQLLHDRDSGANTAMHGHMRRIGAYDLPEVQGYLAKLDRWHGIQAEQETLGQRMARLEFMDNGDLSRYREYTVPGGKNYREFLIQMPVYDSQGWSAEGAKGAFQSNHWEEPNVLAHVRTTDRVDSQGKKVLFVEEIQSDWHQKGRDEGYRTGQLPEGVRIEKIGVPDTHPYAPEAFRIIRPDGHPWPEVFRTKEMAVRQATSFWTNPNTVPDAPFKDNWHELAIKRIIRRAAEEGYDRVAFSPADVHINRWGTEMASWQKEGDNGMFRVGFKPQVRGRVQRYGNWIDLEAEAARRGLKEFAPWTRMIGSREELGSVMDQLKPAQIDRLWEQMQKSPEGMVTPRAEGFKAFYDQKIPQYLKKFGKKFGAELGETSFDMPPEGERASYGNIPGNNQRGYSLDITPSMRKSVMEEGQYLFQKGPGGSKKGAVEFLNDGRALITAFGKADVSTFAHEASHVFEKHMRPEDRAIASKWLGVAEGAEWTTKHKEWFSRGFERYLREGVAPNEGMRGVFENFKNWLSDIYKRFVPGAPNLTPEARALYAKLLGVETEAPVMAEVKSPVEPSKTAQAKAEVRERKAEQAGPLGEQVAKLEAERTKLVERQGRIGRNRPVNDREQAAIIRSEAQRRIENLRRHGASYDEVLRVQAEAKAKIKNLPKLDKPEVGEAEAKWLEKRIAEIDAALNGDDVSKGLRQQALEAKAASQPMPELRKGRPTKAEPGATEPVKKTITAPAQPFNFMGPGAILPEARTPVREGGVVDSADLKPKSKGQSVAQAEAEVAEMHGKDFGSFRDAYEHGTLLFGENFEVTIDKDGRFKPVKKASPQPTTAEDDAWKKANVNNPNWADEQLAEFQRQEEPQAPVASAKKPLAVAPKPPVEAKAKINPDATYSSREQAEFAGEQLHGKGNFAIVESQSVTGKTQFRALKTGATAVAEVAKPQAAVPVAPVTEGETIKAQLPSGQMVEGKVEVVAATGYKIRTAEGKAILVKPEWRMAASAEPVPAPEVVAQTKAISSVPAVAAEPAPPPVAAPKAAVPEKSFLVKKMEREIAYAEKQIEKAQAAGDMDKADAMAGGLAAKRARLEKIKNAQKGNVAQAAVPAKEANVQKSVEAPATPRATDQTPTVVRAKISEQAQSALKLKSDVIGEYPFTEPLVKEIESLLKADPAINVEGKYGLFEKSLKALRDGLHNGDPRALERATEIAIRRNEAGFAGTAPRQFRFNSRMARAIANGHIEVMVRQWENMTDSELALRQVADTITSPNFEKQVEIANDPNLAQRVADVRSRAGRASWEDPTDTLAKTFEGVTLSPKDLAMGAKREHLGEHARQKEMMYRQLNKPTGYAESGLSKPAFAYEWAKNRIGLKSKLDGFVSSWDHRPVEDMVAFIDRMENGDFNSMSPQDRVVGEKLREMLDTKRDEIYGLGEGYFENYLENYFPHIWTDPSKGAQLVHRILGSKSPLGGPQGFLKGRTIEFFKEGLKPQYDSEGKLERPALTPVTYNPIQMALIRLHEMDRFLMAHRIKADLEAQGLTKFFRNDKEVPAGWTRLDDKTFRSYRPETKYELVDPENGLYQKAGTTGKFIENGGYYAPTGAAKVINNYLSPGLRGSKVFRGVRWYGNALNQAQLGLSAFHLTFTGLIDTPISTIALGTKQLLRGALRADAWSAKKGVENTLKGFSILPAIGESVFRGNRMLAEYMEPGQFAEYTRSVEALVEAGGRVRMDPYYRNNSVETVKRLGKEMSLAWRDPNMNAWAKGSKLGIKGTGAIINGAATVLEKAAVPIMEVVVPRMKLGLFYRLAEDVFHRVGPDAPHELIRAELGKAWDTVDNRMGQLVYDNLDWNKTMKDLAMISIRSVGWNFGTWREIGGGFKDAAVNTTKAVKSGNFRRIELTDRMTYLPAMVAYVGMLGAMTNWANTGEMPKSSDDYFFPRTGNKNPDGTDERVEWASYMKDLYPLIVGSIKTGANLGVYAGIKRAGVMLGHKIHPVFGQGIELAENQDYYGREIVHTGDNGFKQAWQIMSHYLKGFEPLTFRNAAERKRSGADFGGQVAAGFGLVPAPKWLGQTPAQEYIYEMAKRHMETGPKTAEDFEKNQLMRQLEMNLDSGRGQISDVYKAVEEGKITLDDADKLLDDMTEDHDPLIRHFKRLDEDEALGGWERANKEEQEKLSEMMDDKVNLALDKLDTDKANEFFQRYIKATKK